MSLPRGAPPRPTALTRVKVLPHIRAVGFDVDGTLLFNRDNTGTLYALAVERVLQRVVGRSPSNRELHTRYAASYEDGSNDIVPPYFRLVCEHAYWPASVGLAEFRTQVRAALQPAREEMISRQLNGPATGASELVRAMVQRGLLLGFATSSLREMADPMLALSFPEDLKHFPTNLRIYGDDLGAKVKPDPLCYELLAQRMGIPPSELLAIEDRPQGAAAGLTAGCGQVISLEGDVTEQDRVDFDKLAERFPERLWRVTGLQAIELGGSR